MIVMVFHTDQFSHYFGLTGVGFWKTKMQSYAVILFFVLSGFLITYLLMKEKEKNGKVNTRNFYIRRILRTWPLYYLVLIIGALLLVLLPGQIDQGIKHSLFITVLAYGILIPNIASFLGYAPDLINILWSVGAEEQFYAFWPLLVNNAKKLLDRIVLFLFAYLALKYLLTWFNFPDKAWSLAEYMPFDCMAIGGIAACLYNSRSAALAIIYHPVIQLFVWIFFVASVFYQPLRIPFLGMLNTDLHALVYAVIILNVSTNPKTLVSLENRVLNFLGKISYGIYGYHFIVLFLLSLCLKNMMAALSSAAAYAMMFTLEIAATIFVAYLSNRLFEGWFLRKKVRVQILIP
jgi:peptidoglycan/LPS O-acetylase OafA/YrhL